MHTKVIKKRYFPTYFEWIKENDYSISSPRHRGFYAEMIFKKYCNENKILGVKINSHFDILEQIDGNFLKKIQQKELKKLGKINISWFCMELGKGYFLEVKMGTSNLTKKQKATIDKFQKNNMYIFRVFEDGDVFIKKEK